MTSPGATVEGLAPACPGCEATLIRAGGGLACRSCGRRFESVAGIPDLRLRYEDPYHSREQDLAEARALAALFDERDLLGLLRELWRHSDRPAELADRFLAGDRVALGRAQAYLDALEQHRGSRLGPHDRVLEVGCGTAALAVAAARRTGAPVVATDISMRWLVVAKKRLADLGEHDVALVCCNGEQLPFQSQAFTLVLAGDVIEHVARPAGFVAECARVLSERGLLFLATPNRLSLGLEPHVRLWGVGLLPRWLARGYVRAVRRTPYDHVKLLSARGLRRLVKAASLDCTIVAPAVPDATRANYRGLEGVLVDVYNTLRGLPLARSLLLAVGPFFHVFARKGAA